VVGRAEDGLQYRPTHSTRNECSDAKTFRQTDPGTGHIGNSMRWLPAINNPMKRRFALKCALAASSLPMAQFRPGIGRSIRTLASGMRNLTDWIKRLQSLDPKGFFSFQGDPNQKVMDPGSSVYSATGAPGLRHEGAFRASRQRKTVRAAGPRGLPGIAVGGPCGQRLAPCLVSMF
jgi:hypothetical protein